MHKLNISVLCLAGIVALALAVSTDDDDMIDYINSLEGNTWKAGNNPTRWRGMGLDMEKNIRYNREHLSYPQIVYPEKDLPKTFDARQKWSNCSTVSKINDQSWCGSCWSFGSIESMSDRFCIHKQENVQLSPEDALSCCTTCTDGHPGCSGGYLSKIYNYWKDEGIVTGGTSFGSKEGCYPYQIDPSLPTPEHKTPPCTPKCLEGYPKTFKQDKHFGQTVYGVSGIENIMKEIVNNGPVTAGFLVYEDFESYKSGVYKHVSGIFLGGHAIKILGYGTEDGQDYWLVANSWGAEWGDKGFFKIAKGVNECQIESSVIAGIPK